MGIFMAGEYDQEIEHLEKMLNAGTVSVALDGQSTTFDLNQVRKRLQELRALNDPTSSLVRPRVVRCNISGAW